uniref:Uncharacterized protein n=1 Tax=Nelumbo nucifera TaxID=4432 RepID=A0A822YF32_NELNU|nr:TPA_asm: hypothetical protein HUJ06_031559 [Nelumbo nucifera]
MYGYPPGVNPTSATTNVIPPIVEDMACVTREAFASAIIPAQHHHQIPN